jgi:SAM-dependent methyltransferase
MPSLQERFYAESRFGGFTDIDGSVAFYCRVNSLLTPDMTVLDVGCGRGAVLDDTIAFRRNLRILRGKVTKVIGIDVDEFASNNPFIDEFHRIATDRWPVESDSIDLLVCDNVLEHLHDPGTFFAESQRVLKQGGYICLRTPNSWSYVALFARLVPNRLHATVLAWIRGNMKAEDVFPTHYRCNSIPALRRMMAMHGFDSVVYGYEAEPSYLSLSSFTYLLGVIHQRIAPGFLKPALFAFGALDKSKRGQ